jgi:hypothetical protein
MGHVTLLPLVRRSWTVVAQVATSSPNMLEGYFVQKLWQKATRVLPAGGVVPHPYRILLMAGCARGPCVRGARVRWARRGGAQGALACAQGWLVVWFSP